MFVQYFLTALWISAPAVFSSERKLYLSPRSSLPLDFDRPYCLGVISETVLQTLSHAGADDSEVKFFHGLFLLFCNCNFR